LTSCNILLSRVEISRPAAVAPPSLYVLPARIHAMRTGLCVLTSVNIEYSLPGSLLVYNSFVYVTLLPSPSRYSPLVVAFVFAPVADTQFGPCPHLQIVWHFYIPVVFSIVLFVNCSRPPIEAVRSIVPEWVRVALVCSPWISGPVWGQAFGTYYWTWELGNVIQVH
jgi:hypothetical protein